MQKELPVCCMVRSIITLTTYIGRGENAAFYNLEGCTTLFPGNAIKQYGETYLLPLTLHDSQKSISLMHFNLF